MDTTVVYVMNVLPLNDDALFGRYYEKLPKERQQKIRRLKNRMDQNRSLGAGILLARGLFSCGIKIEDAVISEDQNGKPYLAGIRGGTQSGTPENVHYNLSHAGDYAAAAFGAVPVGIDIERRRGYQEQVVRKCFCEREQKALASFAGREEREDFFLRCWTYKEGASKVSGLGMRLPFGQIRPDEKTGVEVNFDGRTVHYYLKEFQLPEKETENGRGRTEYRIAVCQEHPDFAEKLIRVQA